MRLSGTNICKHIRIISSDCAKLIAQLIAHNTMDTMDDSSTIDDETRQFVYDVTRNAIVKEKCASLSDFSGDVDKADEWVRDLSESLVRTYCLEHLRIRL